MSLEQLSILGTFATVAIIGATAIVALVQLRHLHAGNQINAILNITQVINGPAFRAATDLIGAQLASAAEDPAFRGYWIALSRGATPAVDPKHADLRAAVVASANTYEELGVLVRNGIIDKKIFVEGFCSPLLGLWRRLAPLTAFFREAESDDALWENFEYLAVLSEDWLQEHTTTYPPDMRRMKINNPWPLPPASAPQ
jgi:hypothetical protein